ncbi:hypothetical protein [Xenorhabdus stockiae]
MSFQLIIKVEHRVTLIILSPSVSLHSVRIINLPITLHAPP